MKLRKMRKQACPYCNGHGEYPDSYDDLYGHAGSFMATCEDCEGKGYILTVKKHCADCGDRMYVEKHVKHCDECNYHRTLKEFETSYQDDLWGCIP
jgi:DnaJ-class molecular chaperone